MNILLCLYITLLSFAFALMHKVRKKTLFCFRERNYNLPQFKVNSLKQLSHHLPLSHGKINIIIGEKIKHKDLYATIIHRVRKSNKNISKTYEQNDSLENIRLMEKIENSIAFNLSHYVCGTKFIKDKIWLEIINRKMVILIGGDLAEKWMKIFKNLESKFAKKENLTHDDHVILAFMRFLFSWNYNVKHLIVGKDQRISDYEIRLLFNASIKKISLIMAVYLLTEAI